jgi:AraC-like DNA-binding protein
MTGQTFHSYLTNIRLYHAYRQLQEQDTTITQIALENGFANVKSFIEAFKKVYHVTPGRYRQQ